MSKLLEELESDGIFNEVLHSMQTTKEGVNALPLLLEHKNVYGRNLYYPACPRSEQLLSLTTHKSFTEDQVEIIDRIGFDVKLVIVHAGRTHKLPFTPREKDEASND